MTDPVQGHSCSCALNGQCCVTFTQVLRTLSQPHARLARCLRVGLCHFDGVEQFIVHRAGRGERGGVTLKRECEFTLWLK